MSGQEIFVIIVVILLLFGADKLPEIARGVSKGMRDFRKATDDIRREFEDSTREIRRDINEVTSSLASDVTDISQNIEKDVNEVADNLKKDVNDFQESINNDVNEVKANLENEGESVKNAEEGGVTSEADSSKTDDISTETTKDEAGTGEASDSYKRTINEPDDNYYNYRD